MENNGENYRSIWSYMMTTPMNLGFVDAGGVKTRYLQAGDPEKPPVLLLHGMNGTLECFCANMPAYAEHFNVIAIDCLGSGFTDAPVTPFYEMSDYGTHIGNVMDAFGLKKASFVCVSLGAFMTIRFALDHPDRVDRMVLCSAGRRRATSSPPVQEVIAGVGKRAEVIANPSWDNVVSTLKLVIHDPANIIPDLVKVRQAAYLRPDAEDAHARILAIAHMTGEVYERNRLSEEDWARVQTPTLVVVSECDDERIKSSSREMAKTLPNGRSLEMANVDHWPQYEDSETFNRESIKFLTE